MSSKATTWTLDADLLSSATSRGIAADFDARVRDIDTKVVQAAIQRLRKRGLIIMSHSPRGGFATYKITMAGRREVSS